MTEQSAPSFKLWWLSINTNKDADGAPAHISPTMSWGEDIVRRKKIAHMVACASSIISLVLSYVRRQPSCLAFF
jgi:hypothetical protein